MAVVPTPTNIPTLPPLWRIRQRFARPRCEDVRAAALAQLRGSGCSIQPGDTVAITVGSRGIANLAIAVRAACDWVREQGGTPLLIPAMGSHGGATGSGQRELIEGYGVTEAAMGAEIRSSMDVVELPHGDCPIPVFLDAHAAACTHILVLNRIKIHTDFHGPYESGLMKMMAIGLGKQAQAIEIHRHGVYGMRDLMPRVAHQVLAQAPILLGLGLIENAYDETMAVRALPAARIPEGELELIDLARANMPRLPLDVFDILVVDRIGKNISGVSMDTNVIGRLYVDGEAEPQRPRITTIIARDLTEATHGNALGVGLADIVTRRLADGIDWTSTYENIYTSTFLKRGFLPVVMETDAQALGFALRAIRAVNPGRERILRIQDTLHLGELHASQAVVDELAGRDDIEIVGPVAPWFAAGPDMATF